MKKVPYYSIHAAWDNPRSVVDKDGKPWDAFITDGSMLIVSNALSPTNLERLSQDKYEAPVYEKTIQKLWGEAVSEATIKAVIVDSEEPGRQDLADRGLLKDEEKGGLKAPRTILETLHVQNTAYYGLKVPKEVTNVIDTRKYRMAEKILKINHWRMPEKPHKAIVGYASIGTGREFRPVCLLMPLRV